MIRAGTGCVYGRTRFWRQPVLAVWDDCLPRAHALAVCKALLLVVCLYEDTVTESFARTQTPLHKAPAPARLPSASLRRGSSVVSEPIRLYRYPFSRRHSHSTRRYITAFVGAVWSPQPLIAAVCRAQTGLVGPPVSCMGFIFLNPTPALLKLWEVVRIEHSLRVRCCPLSPGNQRHNPPPHNRLGRGPTPSVTPNRSSSTPTADFWKVRLSLCLTLPFSHPLPFFRHSGVVAQYILFH